MVFYNKVLWKDHECKPVKPVKKAAEDDVKPVKRGTSKKPVGDK